MGFRCKIAQPKAGNPMNSLLYRILHYKTCKNVLSKVSLLAWMATNEVRQCQQNRGNLTIFQDCDAFFVAKKTRKLTFEAIFLFVITRMVRPVNCALIGLVFVKQKAPFAGHLRHHGRFYILKHFLQKASTILPNVDGQ